jgi:ATP-binding cassette subfamily E protein 1
MPPAKKTGDKSPADRLDRIAIISADRCKPKKCRQECKKSCPVVKIGAFTCSLATFAFQGTE